MVEECSEPELPHPYSRAEVPLSSLKRAIVIIFWIPLLLVLFPIRMLLLLLCILASAACCMVGSHNRSFFIESHRVIGRIALFSVGCWPGQFKVSGTIGDAAIFAIAPHYGLVDAMVVMCVGRCPRPVANAAYAGLPLIGTMFRGFNGIAVHVSKKKEGTSASKEQVDINTSIKQGQQNGSVAVIKEQNTGSVREAIRDHVSGFASGDVPIAIAPEGGTSNGKALLGFFSGAFEGGGSIQPVVLAYPYIHWNAAAFTSGLPNHFFRLLVTPWLRCEATLLPVYHPSDEEKRDPILMASNVRSAMATAARLPLSKYDARWLKQELSDQIKPCGNRKVARTAPISPVAS